MSEPERKAEVVSLREARRRREAAEKARAKAKPVRAVQGRGREPIVRSWKGLGLFLAAMAALFLLQALISRLF